MNRFTINGKVYDAAPMSFNTVCNLEDAGINLSEIGKKKMSVMRAYLAESADISIEEAGEEIQTHLVNGGDVNELLEAMSKAMDESDFFRALGKEEETETPKTEAETAKKK